MTTLTADHVSGPTLAQGFRAALRRFLDAILKANTGNDAGDSFVWGRGL